MKRNNLILCCIFLFTTLACGKSNNNDNTGNTGNQATWPSPPGDVVGKITVGYQGWFACKGDGSPINAWWHWAQDWGQTPSPTNKAMKSWPDVRDYTSRYATNFANLD